MAYRSALEAALARLDAMDPKAACPSCVARSKCVRRIGRIVLSFVVSLAAFAILLLGSIAGFVAACAGLVALVFLLGRASGGGTSVLVSLGFGVLSASAFTSFYYLERRVAFDVGQFG